MHVTLITPCSLNIGAFGARCLSSYLKARGHTVRVITLPFIPEQYRGPDGCLFARSYRYPECVIRQVADLCASSGLVGISFMTQYWEAAVQLTQAVRRVRPGLPVVWGGVHPSVKPEPCLAHADVVCVGEGEEALAELADRLAAGRDYDDVANLCFARDGRVVRNPVRPLLQDLDALPFLDFGPDDHFIRDLMRDTLVPFDAEQFDRGLARVPYVRGKRLRSFMYFTTRGCPYGCTYCVNAFYRSLYGAKGFVRKLSPARVVTELEAVLRCYPMIEEFEFCDDNFALRPAAELAEFAALYRRRIGLPFQLLISPQNITAEKLDPLVEAGLVFVETGIQSAAEVSTDLYERQVEERRLADAVAVLQKHRERLAPPCYHLILDNPFESVDDTLETLDLTLRLPRPFWFKRSSLVAYPGTAVYDHYRERGLIRDEQAEIYRKILETPSTNYVNFLFLLNSQNYPVGLIRFLRRPALVRRLNRPAWIPFWGRAELLVWAASRLWKGLRLLVHGDWGTLRRRLANRRRIPAGVTSSRPPAF